MPLTGLSRELLVLITDLLEWTSPRSVDRLRLVNSQLKAVATYSQHRRITFDISTEHVAKIEKRCGYIETTGLLPAVQELRVTKPAVRRELHCHALDVCLSTVCRLIPRMTELEKLTFGGNTVLDELLAALRKVPDAALFASLNILPAAGQLPGRREDTFSRLAETKNLCPLEVKLTLHEVEECCNLMRPLKHVLLPSSRLRRLVLDIVRPSDGCVSYGPLARYHGLGFADREQMPALEELDLVSYPFGHKSGDRNGIFEANFDGYPGDKPETQFWAESFDWSKLQRLRTADADFAIAAGPRLSALEEFQYYNTWANRNLVDFFLAIPSSLNRISIPSLATITLPGILAHAPTLKEFQIHQSERLNSKWNEHAMDVDRLQRIRQDCPSLTALTLDLPRSGSWPYSHFRILASFPRLQMLDLWFDIGINDPDHPVEPHVTFTSAKHILDFIRSHCEGTSFQKLVLHSGAPPLGGTGFPSPKALWPRLNNLSFVCQVSDLNDTAGDCAFSVVCPDLGDSGKGHPFLMDPENAQDSRSSSSNLGHKTAQLRMGPLKRIRRHLMRSRKDQKQEVKDDQLSTRERMWVVACEGPQPMSNMDRYL